MSSTSKPGSMWILEAECAMNASRVDLMIVSVGEVRPVEEVVMLVMGFRGVNPQAHVTCFGADYKVMYEDCSTLR